MNARSWLIGFLTLGSALLGASIAIQTSPNDVLFPVGQLPQTTTPSTTVLPRPLDQAASLDQTASASKEFEQIRTQLQRAIRERNLVLLRSLMQAGSVREALRSVGAAEPMNFEKIDHSTWTVLEKALNYHCRQSLEAPEPRSCFEHQSPQPLP